MMFNVQCVFKVYECAVCNVPCVFKVYECAVRV